MNAGTESGNLCAFLTALSTDSKLKERYMQNPGAVMSEFQLTAREQWLVMSGNESLIRQSLGDGQECAVIVKF